jgi:hypothetical protein
MIYYKPRVGGFRSIMPELAKQKISKELATGRIAGSCSVVISVHIWGIHLKNKRIIFNVDNQAVVAIINKKSSKSPRRYF